MKLALVSNNATTQGRQAITQLLASLNVAPNELTVGYIASAPDPDRTFFNQTRDFYQQLGVNQVAYLELEQEFSQQQFEKICACSVIHLSGGDTYRFLYWLKQRGLVDTLANLALAGKAFVGVSAGAMLLTPSIESASLCGDIDTFQQTDFTALAVVDFMFTAHAKRDANERSLAEKVAQDNHCPFVLCADEDALVIEGQQHTVFGQPQWVYSAKLKNEKKPCHQ
ncbi:Type 1 glutamine amidotransferase-like domain-containing protein [Shewanella maritima]|uniref:Type 1 glutamine amidotransferase-like domain-containing protein n=1 Tax=Shewanella maritima TaxID=2520507 RepID=UPI003736D541